MPGRCKAALGLTLAALAASPARAQERVPAPPPEVTLSPSDVRFRANVEGVEVLYLPDPMLDEVGGALAVVAGPIERFSVLCVAPCRADLPQSHFGLAVRRGDEAHTFAEPLGIDGPTGVALRFEDRGPERLWGALLLAIGAPLGALTGAVLVGVDVAERGSVDALGAVGLGVGGLVLSASLIVGVLLALARSTWSFEAIPLPADAPAVFSPEF